MSKKYITNLFLITFSFFALTSCDNNAKKVELELVYFEASDSSPGNLYPKQFLEITQTLETKCDKKHDVFAFYPLEVVRKDIGANFAVDYLTNKQGNQDNAKFIQRQLNHLGENVAPAIFFTESNPNGTEYFNQSVASNSKKTNCFIYSKNEDLKIEGETVNYSIPELKAAIGKFFCSNPEATKIIVLVAPKGVDSPPPSHQPDNFSEEIHTALLDIVTCKKEKVYEERLLLAQAFCRKYVDANTELGQFTETGYIIKTHKGEAAAKYIRSLAEEKICMTDLQVATLVQAANGKLGVIKLKEFQAGI